MPYKEREIQKMFYTVGEVANMFSVNPSHIRFWSKQFDVIKPATNKKGNRLFTSKDIDNFKVIYHLVKEKGYTLKGAKVELATRRKKLRIEDKPALKISREIDSEEAVTDTDMTAAIQLFSELVPNDESFVDQIALKNSLEHIRKMLLQLRMELEIMEAQ